MQIVVLDGYTLNPGDLSWEALKALGPCTVHDRTGEAQVVERAKDAEILLVNKVAVSRQAIEQLPKLRYIGLLATGYDIVDCDAARERRVIVTNVPAYGTRSVAQMVFAHLMNLTQHVGSHAEMVRRGRWTECPDFCYWDDPLIELAGLTMGIVGFGRIGRATAEVALAFGMKVLGYDVAEVTDAPAGVAMVDLDTLFRTSDVVSLHCPLTAENTHLVGPERLAMMKPSAFLINTSRGPLVDEAALADALNAGRIAGAGIDVLSVEPPPADHPLLSARNCHLTPHIAWATVAARRRLLRAVTQNVEAFLAGSPQNVVGT